MREENITQADLAKRLGCTPANVSKILQCDSDLKGETIYKVARAVGLELAVGEPGEASAENDAERPRRVLVARPKKKASTKPGQRYDYSSRLAYMARLIVEAKLRGENVSERSAAEAAVEWAKKQEGLVAVTAGTVRGHFALDRDQLLAAARRELGVHGPPRKCRPPAASGPARRSNGASARPGRSQPGLGILQSAEQLSGASELQSLAEQSNELAATDRDLAGPTQIVERGTRHDISKLTNPCGEAFRKLEKQAKYLRSVDQPAALISSSAARLPEMGFPKNDPHLDPHGYVKKTIEDLMGPKIPNPLEPWSL